MRHHITTHTALEDEFVEFAGVTSRMLYTVPNYQTVHEMMRLNIMKPSWMRAPGETPGQYALECAMDELAYKLAMDPVELRRINHAKVNPDNGKPFSSKHVLECYTRGAERFGWAARNRSRDRCATAIRCSAGGWPRPPIPVIGWAPR